MRVVGISPSHDASVCVLNDGVIEGFYKEERYWREKKADRPYLSLIEAKNNLKGPVDKVVIASPDPPDSYGVDEIARRLFNCDVLDMSQVHHLQHAGLAFENSNFDQALIFVLDRQGSLIGDCLTESETVLVGEKDPYSLMEIYKNYWAPVSGFEYSLKINKVLEELNNSGTTKHICRSQFCLTKVYESATTLIGQHPLENGKTMGLTAYGNPEGFPDLFVKTLDPDIHMIPNDSYFNKIEPLTHTPEPVCFRDFTHMIVKDVPEDHYQVYADYAKHVQNQTQQAVSECIAYYSNKTGIKNIVVTGGFGMNVVANSYYVQTNPDLNFFFEPLADDTGNSIGGAMVVYKQTSKDTRNYALCDTFFHGTLTSIGEYDSSLYEVELSGVVELLLQQKSIAVFQGYAEAGQRALGNRSILFDATNPECKKILNRIKKREWYRPFAAMVLEEDSDIYFDMLGSSRNESMTQSYQVRDEYRELLKGIVHVDGSCRLQTITKGHTLYDFLNELKSRDHIGIIANTSFNLAGEPLVETVDDALKTLNESEIDYLWFPEYSRIIRENV